MYILPARSLFNNAFSESQYQIVCSSTLWHSKYEFSVNLRRN